MINIYISRPWVKQITLHNFGGPHQSVEGLKRRTWNPLRKVEFCLQTTCGLKTEHQLVWEFPASQTPLQAADLPVPTTLWTNSLKLPPFVAIHTHPAGFVSLENPNTGVILDHLLSSPPSTPSVMRANQCFVMSTLSLSPPTPSCFRLSVSISHLNYY